MDTDRVKEALTLSLSLMGNTFACFFQERRKMVVGINSQLGHMANEDFDSSDIIFGEGTVDCIKKRVKAIKTLQKVKQPFRQGSAQERGQPVHRGKQGHFQHSVSKNWVLIQTSWKEEEKEQRKGNRAELQETLPVSTFGRWETSGKRPNYTYNPCPLHQYNLPSRVLETSHHIVPYYNYPTTRLYSRKAQTLPCEWSNSIQILGRHTC